MTSIQRGTTFLQVTNIAETFLEVRYALSRPTRLTVTSDVVGNLPLTYAVRANWQDENDRLATGVFPGGHFQVEVFGEGEPGRERHGGVHLFFYSLGGAGSVRVTADWG